MLSDSNGWANVTNVPQINSLLYKPTVKHYDSDSKIDYMGQTLPSFPPQLLSNLGLMKFYLKEAGTLNITVVNSTGNIQSFNYQVKDVRLGYSVEEQWDSTVTSAQVHVQKDRNYSIMVYPDQSVPLSFDWNNFSSGAAYTIDSLSSYNNTSRTLRKQFNATLSLPRISGYVSGDGITSWDELTVIPMLLEPGDMVFVGEDGGFPYNLSAFNTPAQSDNFSASAGFYNITLPASTEEVDLILFATARKGTVRYGGFRNITLATIANGGGNAVVNFNFTQVFGLAGAVSNYSLPDAADFDGPRKNITTKQQIFRLLNGTNNASLSDINAHIEARVDYSDYGAIEFTYMTGLDGSGPATFELPLINKTGVDEINIYTSDFGPKSVSFSQSEINNNQTNITLKTFNPKGIEGAISGMKVGLFKSSTACDVPNPAGDCVIADSASVGQGEDNFNPFAAVLGGGALSFRMGTSTISVHYVNVDLLASGPPDILMDDSADSVGTSGSSFDQAWRFGSGGPSIYDYVLVSIPYSDSGAGGLNESQSVSISIPKFFEEEDFNNAIWDTALNGTNATKLAENFSHYSAKKADWQVLMDGTTCLESIASTGINASRPCFVNKTDNRIWIRLPHFSGTSPKLAGTAIQAAAAAAEEESGSGASASTAQPKTAHTFVTVVAGETNTMEISDDDIPLTQIEFVTNTDVDDVKITVNTLDSKPAIIEETPADDVYEYVEIGAENLANVDIEEAAIRFKVTGDWLQTNDVQPEWVSLYRYADGWQRLETSIVDAGTDYTYEAATPGFSTFAIAAARPAEITVPQNETIGETVTSEARGYDRTLAALVAILIAAGAVYVYKRGMPPLAPGGKSARGHMRKRGKAF